MGLLDLPSPALSLADAQLAIMLSPAARIVTWGLLGAALSTGIYWLLSPQEQLAGMAESERELKRALQRDDLEMADGLASARALLRLALKRIGLILLPVLVAALPVITLAVWLQTHYAHDLPPPARAVMVKVDPTPFEARWIPAEGGTARVEVADDQGAIVHSQPIPLPIPIIHKRAWWNTLIGNPLGYLQPDGAITSIEMGLPHKRYLSFGPEWLRGWETPFVGALLLGSIFLKYAFRIR